MPEVRVQRGAVIEAGQQVLSVGGRREDRATTQVSGGVLRHPEVRSGKHLTGKAAVQVPGGPPDGVTFRHG